MLKVVKESVHRMTSHLQLISGYLEMEDYTKALGKTRETINDERSTILRFHSTARWELEVRSSD